MSAALTLAHTLGENYTINAYAAKRARTMVYVVIFHAQKATRISQFKRFESESTIQPLILVQKKKIQIQEQKGSSSGQSYRHQLN